MKYIWIVQEWFMNSQLKGFKKLFFLKYLKYLIYICIIIFSFMNQVALTLIFLIIILISEYLNKKSSIVTCLTSAREYFTFCLTMTLLSALLIISIILISPLTIDDNYVIMFGWFVLPIIIYCVITLFANTDVSTLVNGIYAGALAILIFFLNKLISFIPTDTLSNFIYDYFGKEMIILIETCIKNNLISSYSEGIDFILTIIILPLFLMFSCATLVCNIKKYWIKKYNHSIDLVDMNQLKNEIINIAFEKGIYHPFMAFENYKEGLDLLEYYNNLKTCDEYNSNMNSILYVYCLLERENDNRTLIDY